MTMKLYVWHNSVGMMSTGVVAVADNIFAAKNQAVSALRKRGCSSRDAEEMVKEEPKVLALPAAHVIDF